MENLANQIGPDQFPAAQHDRLFDRQHRGVECRLSDPRWSTTLELIGGFQGDASRDPTLRSRSTTRGRSPGARDKPAVPG
jgi:hypothetical protein